MTRRTADLEQRTRAIEVDAHPEIEIRLRLPADDGSEVKDRSCSSRDDTLEECPIRDVAGDLRDALIVKALRRDDIGQGDLVNPFVPAIGADEMSAFEQLSRESFAEETGTAGDEYLH